MATDQATDQTAGQAADGDHGLPLAEAARSLGVTENALRKRAQRGSVAAAKGADGLWYVFLGGQDAPDNGQATADADAPGSGLAGGQATARPDRTDDLIAALRAEVDFLRGELTARSEELRRKDHIIAGFIERLPELPAGDEPASASAPPSGRPDDEPRPATEALMLRWRRWFRRMTDG